MLQKKEKIIIFIFLFFFLFLLQGKVLGAESNLKISPNFFDWGTIPQDKKAEAEIKIKNTGNQDIVIKSITTSCACTTARYIDPQGIESPEFGMKGNINWQSTLNVNQQAKLKIFFDPKAHNTVGPVERQVYLKTNLSKELYQIKLKADVYVPGISEEISKQKWNPVKILPVILSTGFLDGINPCAIGVLLLFIAFLFTIRRTKANILWMGLIYIFAIYLAYLGIGLGIFKAIVISGYPNLIGKIAAWLIIVLGLVNILDYFRKDRKPLLSIPAFSKKTLNYWMEKATLPSAFVFGFLVGLCTFPCSGGIYLAIISLLASASTKISGFLYLLLYNLMFVAPLIILLLIVANRKVSDKIAYLEKSKSRKLRLILGILMILISIIILIFFI